MNKPYSFQSYHGQILATASQIQWNNCVGHWINWQVCLDFFSIRCWPQPSLEILCLHKLCIGKSPLSLFAGWWMATHHKLQRPTLYVFFLVNVLSWPVMIKLTLVLVILSSGPTNTQERRRNGSRTTLANSYTCVSVQSTASRWRWGARAPRSSMCWSRALITARPRWPDPTAGARPQRPNPTILPPPRPKKWDRRTGGGGGGGTDPTHRVLDAGQWGTSGGPTVGTYMYALSPWLARKQMWPTVTKKREDPWTGNLETREKRKVTKQWPSNRGVALNRNHPNKGKPN